MTRDRSARDGADGPPESRPSDWDEGSVPNSHRRRVLKTAGVVAVSVSSAGCNGLFDDGDGGDGDDTSTPKPVVSRTERAADIGLTAQGVRRLGYPTDGRVSFTDSRLVTHETADEQYLIDLEEHEFRIDGVPIPIDILASPSATVAGAERNPVLTESLSSHATTGEFDVDWLESRGVVTDSFPEFKSGPTSVSLASTAYSTEPRPLFGTEAEYRVFESVVGPSGSTDRSDWTRVHVALVRQRHDGDGIIVGTAVGVPTTGEIPDERLAYVMERAMLEVTRTPPSSFPSVSLSLSDARLVQTVSDTRVVERDQPYVVDEPDLVLDEYVAPLFSANGPRPPARVYFEITGGAEDRFEMNGADVTVTANGNPNDLGDIASTLDDYRRTDGPPDPPTPFRIRRNTGAVTVDAETPCGQTLDSTTIPRGSGGYSVADPGTMRVGFVACRAPNFLGLPAYGSTSTYDETVDMAVQYLRRTFPGSIYAYRHDRPITGQVAVGSAGLPLNNVPFLKDAGNAQNTLERLASAVRTSPRNGRLFAPGGSRSDASTAIRNNGFNAWMLIVPDGYYDYHGLDAVGKAPFVPKDGSRTPYNWYAATALETGARNSQQAGVMTVAHELGHFFGGMSLYRVGPNDRPLAQRDDRGGNDTIDGESVDYSHARNPNSDHDGDGNTDTPGIESLGFDFTGGTFRHVQNFSINPVYGGTVTNPGMEISPPNLPPRGDPNGIESLMSYRDRRSLWTDAHLHQWLIDADWSQATVDEVTFTARGRPDRESSAEGSVPLQFDSVRLADHGSTPEGTDGTVRVTMRSPSDEVLASRHVPDTVVVSESNDEVSFVTARLPFPDRAVEFRAERRGAVTTLNAVVRPIRDAIGRIPDRGFRKEPEESRAVIAERLTSVESLMEEAAYGSAAEELLTLGEVLREVVREPYEANADQPQRGEVEGLVERMYQRLEGIAGREQ